MREVMAAALQTRSRPMYDAAALYDFVTSPAVGSDLTEWARPLSMLEPTAYGAEQ